MPYPEEESCPFIHKLEGKNVCRHPKVIPVLNTGISVMIVERKICAACHLKHNDPTLIELRPVPETILRKNVLAPASCVSKPGRVGSQMEEILEVLGFDADEVLPLGCGGTCRQWIEKMNRWGVEGCLEHEQEILSRLDEQKKAVKWKNMLGASLAAIGNLRYGFFINPLNPSKSIFDEAIRRAKVEIEERKCTESDGPTE